MTTNTFLCLNGDFLPSDKPVINTRNRAFRYGDGVFESMRAVGTSVPFLNMHLERLRNGAHFLDIELPEFFTFEFITKQISHLLNANKQFTGAKIRLGVFRKNGGSFFPVSNKADYYIESSPLDSNNFQLNNKGLVIDIYPDLKKVINSFNSIKSIPSLLYIKAAIYAQNNKLDDSIILNENLRITESTSSNIFICSNNRLITPSLSEGCLPGIMRNIIINLAIREKIPVSDNACITDKDLNEADEVFLTNAVQGIKWVVAFRNRRYFSKTAKRLNQLLAEFVQIKLKKE